MKNNLLLFFLLAPTALFASEEAAASSGAIDKYSIAKRISNFKELISNTLASLKSILLATYEPAENGLIDASAMSDQAKCALNLLWDVYNEEKDYPDIKMVILEYADALIKTLKSDIKALSGVQAEILTLLTSAQSPSDQTKYEEWHTRNGTASVSDLELAISGLPSQIIFFKKMITCLQDLQLSSTSPDEIPARHK